jgi:hypothetical protein
VLRPFAVLLLLLGRLVVSSAAGAPILPHDRLAQVHASLLENRRAAMPSLRDPFGVPDRARIVVEDSTDPFRLFRGWRGDVVATVFWIGELPSEHNPAPNTVSAWDRNWQANFGGYDQPDRRTGFLPAAFSPKLNPFYVALPYNDIGRDGHHRQEAATVIPWFWRDYRGEGISVCKDRWLAIHRAGKVCYAQWEDVGPFETDHWQYVFGGEDPRPNRNGNAGIDLSPAVRDYLGLKSGERVQWRFIEARDVPEGPWSGWQGDLPGR